MQHRGRGTAIAICTFAVHLNSNPGQAVPLAPVQFSHGQRFSVLWFQLRADGNDRTADVKSDC